MLSEKRKFGSFRYVLIKRKLLLLLWHKPIDNCHEGEIYSVPGGKTMGNVYTAKKMPF